MEEVRLTQFSPGAGCGCKISPVVLEEILQSNLPAFSTGSLLVGNSSRDDAAVYDIGNGKAVISTTDFFMPITDDAFDFGRIASANAISDIYAMGGTPLIAIAILGWPLEKLPASLAQQVLEGARTICNEANIPLAGGHSIDSLEPIFGLAVTGLVDIEHLKRNDTATHNSALYLTKPLGIGILSTAEKNGLLKAEHQGIATEWMVKLNHLGKDLARLEGVQAITDVTGFGLLGHLAEMCEGSGLKAVINWENIPIIQDIAYYVEQKCIPGGTRRNWKSYGHKVGDLTDFQRTILCDPQTSGGLLVAVEIDAADKFEKILINNGVQPDCIGSFGVHENGELISIN